MASGNVKTSTPIQYRHDSGFGSYVKGNNLPKSNIVELSPIRKKPFQSNLSSVLRVCGIFDSGSVKKWNRALDNVTRKLAFTCLSDVSDSDSVSQDADSGIESENVSVENQSLCEKKPAIHKDENCNIIYDCVESDKLYQPYKYICVEDMCDKDSKCYSQNINATRQLCNYHLADPTTERSEENCLRLDLIYELSIRNCTCVISKLLSYLSGEDLRRASYVNKEWQHIVFSDRVANKRREIYINNKRNSSIGPNKENSFQSSSPPGRDHKSAFISVINVSDVLPQPHKHDSFYGRFDSFLEEGKAITEKQALMKCPKCHYPSKAECENKFCCTRKLCQHEFCSKCLSPYFKNHFCLAPKINDSLPKIVIGSKKSRKYLRRL